MTLCGVTQSTAFVGWKGRLGGRGSGCALLRLLPYTLQL